MENTHKNTHIGQRIRELRRWRGMSTTLLADLAGISQPHLSRLERGLRPPTRRATIDALANALRVAVTDITQDHTHRPDTTRHDIIHDLTDLLSWYPGDSPEGPVLTPDAVARAVGQVNSARHVSDYRTLASVASDVLPSLLTMYESRSDQQRRTAAHHLADLYQAAMAALKTLRSSPGLLDLAVAHVRTLAATTSDPQHEALAAWMRSQSQGAGRRPRQYAHATSAIRTLEPHSTEPGVPEGLGQVHLSAALAAAAMGRRADAYDHIARADEIATRVGGTSAWRGLWFGPLNVDVWRLAIAAELGDHGQVDKLGNRILPRIGELPAAVRRADVFVEWGRALLADRRTEQRGLQLLLRAEQIAPLIVYRSDVIRSAVASMLERSRAAAGGTELRGLAHRMRVTA
ncbi:helix-turn-helix domain-containing protein [Actinoalloteichus caeruleus]|uniref:helix-turn-helix domain-containing protein n=1 Tax=Actinoalloteichus cyanogriseus TaxID=2893586 RepID=UPI003AACA440